MASGAACVVTVGCVEAEVVLAPLEMSGLVVLPPRTVGCELRACRPF